MSSHFDPYGNRCKYACQPPYNYRSPCSQCRALHQSAMDEAFEEHVNQREAQAIDEFIPAADREWRDQLDLVAPVVPVNDSFTSVYFASL